LRQPVGERAHVLLVAPDALSHILPGLSAFGHGF
jgi:hypothetical protein